LEGQTGLNITTNCRNWRVAIFSSPRVRIGEKTRTVNWGTHFFELVPGEYQVEIYFRYLFMKLGVGKVKVEVAENHVIELGYVMPSTIFGLFAEGEINLRR
jgi:hypothetical protein